MRRALGRGLSQLLGETAEAAPTELSVDQIQPNQRQPRRLFDEAALQELADSIQQVGLIQPLVVRPISEGRYELIAGERRLRAARLAGLTEVPVTVRSAGGESSLQMALIENVQREDISAVECAYAYRQLSEEFGFSQEEIARRVGKSRSGIANTMRLLALPEEIRDKVQEGLLTEGHARALLMCEDDEHRMDLFERVLGERLTVRQVEEMAKRRPDSAVVSAAGSEGREASPPADWAALEGRLSERFGSPVELRRKRRGGRMVVAYSDDEDLQRILDVLGISL